MTDQDYSLPIDVSAFLGAADLARTLHEDFELAEVSSVEQAWQIVDLDTAVFGFVVLMQDGRRLYVEYIAEDMEAGQPPELSLRELSSGETRPNDLPDHLRGVDWYKPEAIDDYLDKLR